MHCTGVAMSADTLVGISLAMFLSWQHSINTEQISICVEEDH